MKRFEHRFSQVPENLKGKIIDNHFTLDIIGPEAHFWSPHLGFRIEEDEEDKSKAVISGLIGPKPSVWTMFMFFYFAIGVLGFFLSAFAYSKITLGEKSALIWAFPVSIVFMLSAYLTSKFGERLGKEQIEEMKTFLNPTLDDDYTYGK